VRQSDESSDTTLGSCSANKESSQSSAAWKANPLFKGIEPQQIRRSTEDQRRSSFQSLCNEARRASKELIDILPGETDVPVHVVVETAAEPAEQDLEELTKSALILADEAITACLVDKRSALERLTIAIIIFC